MRIQFSFDRPKRGREKLGTLTVIPGPVITADRVVMGDSAASLYQRVARGILDRLPLFQQSSVAAERVK